MVFQTWNKLDCSVGWLSLLSFATFARLQNSWNDFGMSVFKFNPLNLLSCASVAKEGYSSLAFSQVSLLVSFVKAVQSINTFDFTC